MIIKLSIIIPAYNAAKWIEKCVHSCENQDIDKKSYELIIVDDGSTDNTADVVKSLQHIYCNIVYVWQENGALGSARNHGLRVSKGEYVWFVDADDWIEDNCLGEIIKKLKLNNLTGLYVGHVSHYKTPVIWPISEDTLIESGKDVLRYRKEYISATYALWRRDYLEEIGFSFVEHTFHEDMISFFQLTYPAPRVGYLKKTCYNVYINQFSITRSINPKRSFDLIKVCNILVEINKQIMEPEIKRFVIDTISKAINASLFNSFRISDDNCFELNKAWKENIHLFYYLRKSGALKYKIEGFLFLLMPNRIIQIYRFMQKFNRNPGGMNQKQL